MLCKQAMFELLTTATQDCTGIKHKYWQNAYCTGHFSGTLSSVAKHSHYYVTVG